MHCLLDTSAIAALAVESDEHHREARDYSLTPQLRLHTTSAAVGETFTLLRAHTNYRVAIDTVTGLRGGSVARVHHVDEAFDAEAWRIIEEFGGVPLSYVDATLIALGRRLRLRRIFTFDDDFRQAGLDLVPR